MKTIIPFILFINLLYGYPGKIVGITDGDTIKVLDDKKVLHKVRLYGIDAPEKFQEFGTQSKKALSDLIFDKDVEVFVMDIDRYEREIGKIFCENLFINDEMVKMGMAWHYVQYAKNDKQLAISSNTAQEKKLGLWSGNAIAPWEFRRDKK